MKKTNWVLICSAILIAIEGIMYASLFLFDLSDSLVTTFAFSIIFLLILIEVLGFIGIIISLIGCFNKLESNTKATLISKCIYLPWYLFHFVINILIAIGALVAISTFSLVVAIYVTISFVFVFTIGFSLSVPCAFYVVNKIKRGEWKLKIKYIIFIILLFIPVADIVSCIALMTDEKKPEEEIIIVE